MSAFVFSVTSLLFIFTVQNTLIVSPALLPKGNLTKILDILNERFGIAKKNATTVDDTQSNLTEKEQKLMDILMNRLYKRVIEDSVGSNKATKPPERGNDGGSAEKADAKNKDVTLVSTVANPSVADERDYTDRDDPPAGSAIPPGKRHDVNHLVAEHAVAPPKPPDPLLLRFVRLADMLDRPDGVDEAVQTMLTIPSSLLNKSAALDERCPFDRMVDDDQQLVEYIVKRLRYLHGGKSVNN